jgi:UDP-2,3-diacylglucosamine pyrophosphatase LpxH
MRRGRRLFIISDLHLGGRPEADGQLGFQICKAYRELVEFVDWVSGQGGHEDLELVINGDIVDFLAEDDYPDDAPLTGWTADDAAAVGKLERVFDHTRAGSDRGLFNALGDLLAAGHRLTLMLGNHDVELALPAVRRRLEVELGDRGRLRFVHDGEAYTVGPVLIEHGNRYDPWNLLDFDRLRQERSVRSRNMTVEGGFEPPSGTLLVTSFMNPLKRRYRFIDLLKPETGAVLPLLLALEPDLDLGLRALLRAAPIIKHRAKVHHDARQMPTRPGEMGGSGTASAIPQRLDDVLRDVLGRDAWLFTAPGAQDPSNHLGGIADLRAALAAKAKQLRALAEDLHHLHAIRTAPSDDIRRQRLRAALAAAGSRDRSFDLTCADDDYATAARTLCTRGGFDVIVFGHTHLPRFIDLTKVEASLDRPCWYLNTGTWADVIRLDQLPQPVDDAFIDAAQTNQLAGYTRRYLTYAEIVVDEKTVREVHLRSFCGKARPREAPLVSSVP